MRGIYGRAEEERGEKPPKNLDYDKILNFGPRLLYLPSFANQCQIWRAAV